MRSVAPARNAEVALLFSSPDHGRRRWRKELDEMGGEQCDGSVTDHGHPQAGPQREPRERAPHDRHGLDEHRVAKVDVVAETMHQRRGNADAFGNGAFE